MALKFFLWLLYFASERNQPVSVDRSWKNGDIGPAFSLRIVHFNCPVYKLVSVQSSFEFQVKIQNGAI